MEYSFTAVVRLTLEPIGLTGKSKHVGTDFMLELSDNLDQSAYLDDETLPTKMGSDAITQTLIAGLSGAIKHSHQKGYKNDVENLRYVIAELERHVFSVSTVEKGEF